MQGILKMVDFLNYGMQEAGWRNKTLPKYLGLLICCHLAMFGLLDIVIAMFGCA